MLMDNCSSKIPTGLFICPAAMDFSTSTPSINANMEIKTLLVNALALAVGGKRDFSQNSSLFQLADNTPFVSAMASWMTCIIQITFIMGRRQVFFLVLYTIWGT